MNSRETGPINLGNPDEKSIMEIAEQIVKLTGSKSEFVFKTLPVDDPLRRKPSITKAKNLLNWEPQVTFEDGMKKTIDYFKISLSNHQ